MSKLSFRARTLDNTKPMPIFMAEELPDLPDFSAINRAVPQMPSGMQKEEECEHHLQRAIVAGLIIPTPEVSDIPNKEFYDKVYPANYKQPRQLIHMQPFTMEQDIPDYDMDSDDEHWLHSQTHNLDLSALKFEEMMDRLEKSSGKTAVTLNDAKALLKEDDDLIIAVFDYWLNKRLKMHHPLILTVKTEHRSGTAANNPYLAFRRRTEKMQTRKIRKNDEVSYEKMLKLRRDLYRAVTLLELVKRREKIKREYVHLTIEVFEKRYQAKDFSGSVLAEASAAKTSSRPAFTPIFHNHYTNPSWSNKTILKDEVLPRREKRQYKKRKHKSLGSGRSGGADSLGVSSDEDVQMPQLSPEATEEPQDDEGQFAFRRNKFCSYHMPLRTVSNWPWCSKEENGKADPRFRFTLTSLSNPRRCIGFARRRIGRGGRVILDRVSTDYDDFWRTLDFSINEPQTATRPPPPVSPPSAASVSACVVGDDGGESVVVKSEFGANSSICTASGSTWTNDGPNNVDSGVYSGTSVVDRNSFSSSNRIIDSVTSSYGFEVKKEVIDVKEEDGVTPLVDVQQQQQEQEVVVVKTEEDKDEMVEFLRSLRRDWLHFRPKTPPPDWEPPCDMIYCPETFFDPCSANAPFSMEIQPLDPANNSFLLDKTSFITDPFGAMMDIPEVTATTTTTTTTTPAAATAASSMSLSSSSLVTSSIGSVVPSSSGTVTLPAGAVTLSTGATISTQAPSTSVASSSGTQDPLVNTLILPHSVSFSSTYSYDTNSRDSTSSSDSNSDYRTIGCTTFRLRDCGESSSGTSNSCRQYQQQNSSNHQQNHQKSQQQHQHQQRRTSAGTSGIILSSSLCGGTSAATNRKLTSSFINSSTTTAAASAAASSSGTSKAALTTTTTAVDNESVLAVRLGTARPRGGNNADSTSTLGSTNGLLTQFDFDVPQNRPRNNKLSYAYPGAGYQKASSSTLSLHTSAHTLTLNSHSANILDIPMTDEGEPTSSASNNKKLNNASVVGETSGGGGSTNNKTSKPIVRKNNIIMEVT